MLPTEKFFHKYPDVSVELSNGNEVIEMGGIWYENSVPAHL